MSESPEVGDCVGDFALLGGMLERGAFTLRSYMLCRRRGPVLLYFTPEPDHGDHAHHVRSYADCLASISQRVACALWVIGQRGLAGQESLAREYGLSVPLLYDVERAVAEQFGVALHDGAVRSAMFLVASDRTLLWKCLSPSPGGPDLSGALARHLIR